MKKIVGKLCYLSPTSVDQAESVYSWVNDLETAILLGDEAWLTIPLDDVKESIQGMIKGKTHIYSIHDIQNDTLIGRLLLVNIDHINRSAWLGVVLGEKKYWGKGYGTEACKLILDFGFNALNLHNITLGVFSYNTRAIKSYEKIGFKLIGRRREARIIGTKKYDVLLMDILSYEFESPVILPIMQKILDEK